MKSPTKPQILAWRNDPVTLWMLESLRRQFPPQAQYLPIESLVDANHKSGQQSVLRALQKLYDFIPEDSA